MPDPFMGLAILLGNKVAPARRVEFLNHMAELWELKWVTAPAEAASEGSEPSDEDRGVLANRAYWEAYGENVLPVNHCHAHLRGVTGAYDAGRASLAKLLRDAFDESNAILEADTTDYATAYGYIAQGVRQALGELSAAGTKGTK
ncbi:MAG TPA: hypothetical protein VGK73_30830 [Polyangiaceae bacterium]